jgi:alpha-tubulin suppressor-like RCC1 family protein
VDWGDNAKNDLAPGYEDKQEFSPVSVLLKPPNPVEELSNVKQVADGSSTSFALLAKCTVMSWGGDDVGTLGDGQALQETEGQLVPVPVKQLVTREGEAFEEEKHVDFGENHGGVNEGEVRKLSKLKDIKEIIAGNANVIALTNDGRVYTWGASEYGTRGNGEKNKVSEAKIEAETTKEPNRLVPRTVALEIPIDNAKGEQQKVKQVVAGGRRDFALTEHTNTEGKIENEVYVWGEDPHKELGIVVDEAAKLETCNGDEGLRKCLTRPAQFEGLEGQLVESLGAGENATYAVLGTGPLNAETTVVAWGQNNHGELGDGKPAGKAGEVVTTPVEVEGLPKGINAPKIREVQGGVSHALARAEGVGGAKPGTAYAWGENKFGELGYATTETCKFNGEAPCSNKAKRVPVVPTKVEEVSAGGKYSQVLDGGNLYAMGKNFEGFQPKEGETKEILQGQLGIGENVTFEATPTKVDLRPEVPLEAVAGVATGYNHTVAFLQEGKHGPLPRLAVTRGSKSLTAKWNWTFTPAANGKYESRLFNPEPHVAESTVVPGYGECHVVETLDPPCERSFNGPEEKGLEEKPYEVVVSVCEFEVAPEHKGCESSKGEVFTHRKIIATPEK